MFDSQTKLESRTAERRSQYLHEREELSELYKGRLNTLYSELFMHRERGRGETSQVVVDTKKAIQNTWSKGIRAAREIVRTRQNLRRTV